MQFSCICWNFLVFAGIYRENAYIRRNFAIMFFLLNLLVGSFSRYTHRLLRIIMKNDALMSSYHIGHIVRRDNM